MNDGRHQSNSMISFFFSFFVVWPKLHMVEKKISRMNPKKSHSKVLLPIVS